MKKTRLLCFLLTLLLFAGCAPVPAEPSGDSESPSASASGEVSPESPSEPSSASSGSDPVSSSDTSSEPVTPPVTPVFELPELPEIGEYDAVTVKRISPDYIDHFTPADDYGTLYPYAAVPLRFVRRGVYPMTYWQYGLCTADGTVVTDPIYTEISAQNGYYLLWECIPIEHNSENARCTCIPADGSSARVLPITRYDAAYPTAKVLSDGRVLYRRYNGGLSYGNEPTCALALDGSETVLDKETAERLLLDGPEINRQQPADPDGYNKVGYYEDKVYAYRYRKDPVTPCTDVTVWDGELQPLYSFTLPGYSGFSDGWFCCDGNWYALDGSPLGPFEFEGESEKETYWLEKVSGRELMEKRYGNKREVMDPHGRVLFKTNGWISYYGGKSATYCFTDTDYSEDKSLIYDCYRIDAEGNIEMFPETGHYLPRDVLRIFRDGANQYIDLRTDRIFYSAPVRLRWYESATAADGKALLFYTANGVTCSRFADGEIYMKIQSENG